MEGFLNAAPVFFGNQDRIGAFAGDLNRLVGGGGLIEQLVELGSGLA